MKRIQEKRVGRSTKTPQEKTPSCMQITIIQKYLIPQKNISNAKEDKLSNHRQEHPTKKIQEFMQKISLFKYPEPRVQNFPMGYNEGGLFFI